MDRQVDDRWFDFCTIGGSAGIVSAVEGPTRAGGNTAENRTQNPEGGSRGILKVIAKSLSPRSSQGHKELAPFKCIEQLFSCCSCKVLDCIRLY